MVEKQPPGESPEAYMEIAARPVVWQWVARDLLAAANALHVHRRGPGPRKRKGDSPVDTSSAPILLLYGMGLEDLLKGLLIAQGRVATVGGRLNPELKTHDVLKLWRMAKLTHDEQEETLLSALTWVITTGGRYPVGLSPNPTSMRYLHVGVAPVECFIALFERAEKELRRCLPDGPLKETNLLHWGV